MKKATLFTLIITGLIWLPSCYKNYYDIQDETLTSINSVSFRNDVVPIMTSGACGCHNTKDSTRQIQFSDPVKDTIYYGTIQTRAKVFYDMANGGLHPAEGSIHFTPSQSSIVIKWYEQGAKDDYVPPAITGDVTYVKHIVPLVKSDCNGGTCHGGVAIVLDYDALKSRESIIKPMMISGGQSGHPGGVVPVPPLTSATFLAWIAQGYKYQ
jgi:hypothetical protein